jgi:prepilin signal peptidase PulO-like enzyme (type II secretory pathway)
MVGAVVGTTLILTKKMSSQNPMPFGPMILIVSAFQIFFPEYAMYLQSFFF